MTLFIPLCFIFLLRVLPLYSADIYVHMMPWFETKETNNGVWGQHWTMANQNPDIRQNGVPQIAAFYHPAIGPYASGDPDVIDWQLSNIKAAGIAGIFLDWPGTTKAFDYAKNKQNAEAIIEGTKRAGLKFAIVYEDNNLNLASVPNKIEQAQSDMRYLQNNYFNQKNYVKVKNAPLLLDFGPQALHDAEWDQVLAPLNPKPTFLTLSNQGQQGGTYVKGEYAWVWEDYVDSLTVWYTHRNVSVKIGVAYPGFHPFYASGGWPGPTFNIEYGVSTFNTTWQMALDNVDIIQICTWNDYGEGTIIEPTLEYGTQFLEIIRQYTRSKFRRTDFQAFTDIYFQKKKVSNNLKALKRLRQKLYDLVHKYG